MTDPPTVPYPGPDISIAGRTVGITALLFTLSVSLYGLRMYTRLRPVPNLGMDDLTMTVSIVLALIGFSLTLAALPYGYGHHEYYISADNQMIMKRLLLIYQPFWSWSTGFSKISIACMLLRIKQTPQWRIFLYGTIAVQVGASITGTVFQLAQCRPMAALWDPSLLPTAKCISMARSFISVYVIAGVAIATDIIFSLLPITFIRNINRPLREKIVLACLMGLGLFTCAVCIVKTAKVGAWGGRGDTLFFTVDLNLWFSLEEYTGIIAACIPCLRAPGEKVLRRLGLLSTNGTTSAHTKSQYERYGEGTTGRSYWLRIMKSKTTDDVELVRQPDRNVRRGSEENIFPVSEEQSVSTEAAYSKANEVGWGVEGGDACSAKTEHEKVTELEVLP